MQWLLLTLSLLKPVLAGTVITEVAHLRDLGYLLHLDFVENIATCHLVPDVRETNDLSSTLCPHLTCPAGWKLLQNTCFQVTQVSGSWGEGQTFCQQLGGTLATISSNFQQVALSDMLADDTWIGLRRRHDSHTYTWTDGSEHTYTSWAQNEQSISETFDREKCVEMRQAHSFLWSAAPCDQSKQYLCSVPYTAVTATIQRNNHSIAKAPTTPPTTNIITTPTIPPSTNIITTPTTPPTTTITMTTSISQCESGWNQYQSSCYKVFKQDLTYAEGKTNCRALGAYLASINNEGENSFVTGLLEKYSHIGLSDEEIEGVFTWQDGSPFNYSKWYNSGPGDKDGNRDCVGIETNSRWWDWYCGSTYHHVCEKSIQ